MAKVHDHRIDLSLAKTDAMLNTLETPLVMSPEARLKLAPVASASAASTSAGMTPQPTTPASAATPDGTAGIDFPDYHAQARKNTDNPNYKVSISEMDEDDTLSKEEEERMNA